MVIFIDLTATAVEMYGGIRYNSLGILSGAMMGVLDAALLFFFNYFGIGKEEEENVEDKRCGRRLAVASDIILAVVSAGIIVGAWRRLGNPQPPELDGLYIMAVAGFSAILNLASLAVYPRNGNGSANIKSGKIKVWNSFGFCLAGVADGAIIHYLKQPTFDAWLSIGIAAVIVVLLTINIWRTTRKH
jgi:Co/Zn/Cd efflux system component